MQEVLEILVAWAVTIAGIAVLVRLDERHLDRERLARAWPPSTFMSALGFVVLGGVLIGAVLALVAHFGRTRRSVWGVVLGLLAAALVFALAVAGMVLVDVAYGGSDGG